MSAIGNRVGVVSLGMCCQASIQIRENVDLIARASGDSSVRISGMPFDGLICPPASASKMLAARTFYPENPQDIDVKEGAYWRDFNVYYWHEYRPRKSAFHIGRSSALDLDAAYRDLTGRYRHLASKFHKIADIERLVFVICNSQNNLPLVSELTGTIDYVLDAEEVERLCDACDGFFGRRCEYILATYPDRLLRTPRRSNLARFDLPTDDTEWSGSAEHWGRLFLDYFGGTTAGLTGGADLQHRTP